MNQFNKYKHIALILIFSFQASSNEMTFNSVELIWNEAPHNAFPSAVYFGDAYYVTFREGDSHANTVGNLRVIRSTQEGDWESVAEFTHEDGWDIREGHISILPSGELMIAYTANNLDGPPYLLQTYLTSSENGITWTPEIEFAFANYWVKTLKWYDEVGYTTGFHWTATEDEKVLLFTTEDGFNYSVLDTIDVNPLWEPSETDLQFDEDGHLWASIRTGGNPSSDMVLADAALPYTNWQIREVPAGPFGKLDLFLLQNDWMILGSRAYDGEDYRTGIFTLDLDSARAELEFYLPSGGDNSYPEMLVVDNQLQVFYYSSHEDSSTNIYHATIDFNTNTISENDLTVSLPSSSELTSVWPNPFNSAFMAKFTVPNDANIRISLFDVIGREIDIITNKQYSAGKHLLRYSNRDHPSGNYYLHLISSDGNSSTIPIIHLK